MTPTQRSLAYMRKAGFRCATVEKWNPHCKIRQDLFGFIDLLCIAPGHIIGVQTTTRSNQAARLAKALAAPALREWLVAGGRFQVHGWAKVGARGKRKLWDVAMRIVTLDDLN